MGCIPSKSYYHCVIYNGNQHEFEKLCINLDIDIITKQGTSYMLMCYSDRTKYLKHVSHTVEKIQI